MIYIFYKMLLQYYYYTKKMLLSFFLLNNKTFDCCQQAVTYPANGTERGIASQITPFLAEAV